VDPVGELVFPEPTGINVNMMPFIMGDKDSIPEKYMGYWPLICACKIPKAEEGKVGYLTVHESIVAAGQTQRRPGLHIEVPGLIKTDAGQYKSHPAMWGCGFLRATKESDSHPELPRVEGGIYMANNVTGTCRLYNCFIKDPDLICGENGDLEQVRALMPQSHEFAEPSYTDMEANTIYWLTDRTPHESLSVDEETHRQFFRVVTSKLSAWFPEHSTANPLGIQPDQKITEVIPGNKF